MKRRLLLTAVLVTVALLSGVPAETSPDADLLIANLNYSASPHLKIQAMKALSMRHDQRAVDAIYQNTTSPYLDVRLNALRSLSRYHDPADLPFLESIILDYQGQYTVPERIVAIKAYVNIPGWDPAVLEEAQMLADNPVEEEILKKALLRESLKLFNLR